MSVIVILILASLSLALAFLAGFIWAVSSGQYEDTFTPSMRVLAEEEGQRKELDHSSRAPSRRCRVSGAEGAKRRPSTLGPRPSTLDPQLPDNMDKRTEQN